MLPGLPAVTGLQQLLQQGAGLQQLGLQLGGLPLSLPLGPTPDKNMTARLNGEDVFIECLFSSCFFAHQNMLCLKFTVYYDAGI